MDLIEELNRNRKLAGMDPLTLEQIELLDERKKKKEVDDGEPGPSDGADAALKKGQIKPSTKGKAKEDPALQAIFDKAGKGKGKDKK